MSEDNKAREKRDVKSVEVTINMPDGCSRSFTIDGKKLDYASSADQAREITRLVDTAKQEHETGCTPCIRAPEQS